MPTKKIGPKLLDIIDEMMKLSSEDQRAIRQLIEDPPLMEKSIVLTSYDEYSVEDKEISIFPVKSVRPGRKTYTIEFNSDLTEVFNFIHDLLKLKRIEFTSGSERNINVSYFKFHRDMKRIP